MDAKQFDDFMWNLNNTETIEEVRVCSGLFQEIKDATPTKFPGIPQGIAYDWGTKSVPIIEDDTLNGMGTVAIKRKGDESIMNDTSVMVMEIKINGRLHKDFYGTLHNDVSFPLGEVAVAGVYASPKYRVGHTLTLKAIKQQARNLMESMMDYYLTIEEGICPIFEIEAVNVDKPWISYTGEFMFEDYEPNEDNYSNTPHELTLTSTKGINEHIDESKVPKIDVALTEKQINHVIASLLRSKQYSKNAEEHNDYSNMISHFQHMLRNHTTGQGDE